MSQRQSLAEWWRERGGPVGTLLVAALIIGSSIGFAARAEADTLVDAYTDQNAWRVCEVLDQFPSEAGVLGVVQGIHEDGLSYFDAGQVVGLSVYGGTCPWHSKLLDAFVRKYATKPGSVYVAGAVGGRVER